MHTRTSWRRRPAILTLILHLILVGAGPVADAHLESRHEVHDGVHIHSADDAPCAPQHRHDHCQICRTFQSFDVPEARKDRLPVTTVVRAPAAPRARTVAVRTPAAAPLGARAPPQA